nr:hypothetical protein NPLVJFJD_NPLVJFJD_CDS_0006 [Microvirus sp.]
MEKVEVTYKGFPHLSRTFDSLVQARVYCESVYIKYGFYNMIFRESVSYNGLLKW